MLNMALCGFAICGTNLFLLFADLKKPTKPQIHVFFLQIVHKLRLCDLQAGTPKKFVNLR